MRALATTLAIAVSLVLPAPALAGLEDDLARVDRRIDDLRSQVATAGAERTDLANAVLDLAADLDATVSELARARARLDGVDADIAATEGGIEELTRRISRDEAEAAQLALRIGDSRAAALERAVQLYMSADGGPQLLAIDDAQAAAVGLAYADRAQEIARREVSVLGMLRAEEQRAALRLGEQRSALEAALHHLEDARAQREMEAAEVAARTDEVASRLGEQEALLAEVDALVEEIEGELAGLAAEQARITELIEQEQSAGGDRPGILARPVPGAVSSGFGYRVHPIYGDRRLHTGWDMNAACGEPIRAAASGRVFLADWKGGYGITVMIDHGGGMATLYAHQSRMAVGYGQQVSAGDVIGYAGTTGVSTGCHLHFEVRIGGTPVDPSPYL